MKKSGKPAIGRLLEVLDYNPDTGIFTWLVQTNPRALAGRRAGAACGQYREIQLDNIRFYEHQAAIAMSTGTWPPAEVDHRNGQKTDNRLANLRPATTAQNKANIPVLRSNTSGTKGVGRRNGRFRAQMSVDGRSKHIGVYDTQEAAADAYAAATRARFGDFARLA